VLHQFERDSISWGHRGVILGYTTGVKTAISIPDDTFARATRRAQELGMSRSAFFSRAAGHYLDSLDAESTTRQIDAALTTLDHPDESATDAVEVGHAILAATDDEW